MLREDKVWFADTETRADGPSQPFAFGGLICFILDLGFEFNNFSAGRRYHAIRQMSYGGLEARMECMRL